MDGPRGSDGIPLLWRHDENRWIKASIGTIDDTDRRELLEHFRIKTWDRPLIDVDRIPAEELERIGKSQSANK